jgi:photosystem II stability/assembly factor-like uncharacterized protein
VKLKLLASALTAAAMLAAQNVKFDSDTISGLGARNIGSAEISGRVATVTAVRQQGRLTVYVGSADGGVWKSVNGGTTFKPVFDKEAVQSIGAIAVDPSNPKNVWVGTGESWTRNSVSIGDGIYKSTDGGENWKNTGLKNSERVSKIVVDPKDSSTVYACVPGKLWSDSDDRGLYKTEDGGKNWHLILKGANASTGCSSVSMSPTDHKTLYAGTWDFRRKGWTFRSGGDDENAKSGSAFFKTTDGGSHWSELSADSAKGLPAKPWGRVTVAVAPSNADAVYVLIEAKKSALYRSSDGGKTWQEGDNSQMMIWRPFYFSNLIVDPKDENKIYKPGGGLILSVDGGKSFSSIWGGAHGDFHDVWVDPDNTNEVITCDDGGVWYSHDSGEKWLKSQNLPIGQFYHVSVDMADPYHVYGGLQDNSAWIGDSAYPGGISNSRWENIDGGDGFFAFADPSDPNYIYAESQGGAISRINRHTLENRSIQPQQKYGEGKLRFNWNTPMVLSPTNVGTLYIGAQYLFRSRDHGQTWDRISPDLTTNDPEKQKQEESGGITVDNSVAEMHTTIYSVSESPKNPDVVWAGTDDGNLQLTRNGGKSWTNVVTNIPDLPKFSWVSWVEASRFDEGTAYATFDLHTFGDMAPRAYKTNDFGKTWERIVSPDKGIRGYAHVIKEDTVAPDLLFLGTEFGLYISIDGGGQWAQYKGHDFPNVAVRDLAIQPRESDLVLATHGRGIWIIDDISPLRQLNAAVLNKEVTFLESKVVQQRIPANGGWSEGDGTYLGPDPPDAAVITYYQQKRHIFGRMKLEVFDDKGTLVDTLAASSRRGISRVEWSMRLKAPTVPPGAVIAPESTIGPRVVPGTYTVKLTRNKEVLATQVVVRMDPRAKYSLADRQLEFDSSMRVYRLLGDLSFDVARINGVREALLERAAKLGPDDPLNKQLATLADKSDIIRKKIVATKEGGAITGEERIREKTSELYGALVFYEGKPADYYVDRIESLTHESNDVAAEFDKLLATDLKAVNASLVAKRLQDIHPLDRATWEKNDEIQEAGGSPGAAKAGLRKLEQLR